MHDLALWLTAQLDAEEAEARLTADAFGTVWTTNDAMESVGSDTGADVVSEPYAPRSFIAEHDPARVLREIDAKRKLLALLPDLAHADRMIEGEWGSSDDLAEKLLDALLTPYPKCGATTVFWPEDEACDAVCVWPRGHGGVRHIDETLGEWDEEELATSHPSE